MRPSLWRQRQWFPMKPLQGEATCPSSASIVFETQHWYLYNWAHWSLVSDKTSTTLPHASGDPLQSSWFLKSWLHCVEFWGAMEWEQTKDCMFQIMYILLMFSAWTCGSILRDMCLKIRGMGVFKDISCGQNWFRAALSSLGFPGVSDGEDSVCNAGDLGSIPRLGRSPGEGNGNPC